jgi:hypothetical protein
LPKLLALEPSQPANQPSAPKVMENTNTLIYLLKDRFSFIDEIHNSEKLNSKIVSLLFTSFSCFAIYGAIIGATNSNTPIQIISSAIKLPALYLITLIVCFPTLYIFNAFFGSRSTVRQHWAYLLATITVIAVLLCGFAPITLFFLLTVNDRFFFLLLNVAIFTITGTLGVSFLYRTMKPSEAQEQTFGWDYMALWVLNWGGHSDHFLELVSVIFNYFGLEKVAFLLLSGNLSIDYSCKSLGFCGCIFKIENGSQPRAVQLCIDLEVSFRSMRQDKRSFL